MPEIAVYEDGQSGSCEHDIGLAGQVSDVLPEAQSSSMQR
jgi:hypothetical protein